MHTLISKWIEEMDPDVQVYVPHPSLFIVQETIFEDFGLQLLNESGPPTYHFQRPVDDQTSSVIYIISKH